MGFRELSKSLFNIFNGLQLFSPGIAGGLRSFEHLDVQRKAVDFLACDARRPPKVRTVEDVFNFDLEAMRAPPRFRRHE